MTDTALGEPKNRLLLVYTLANIEAGEASQPRRQSSLLLGNYMLFPSRNVLLRKEVYTISQAGFTKRAAFNETSVI